MRRKPATYIGISYICTPSQEIKDGLRNFTSRSLTICYSKFSGAKDTNGAKTSVCTSRISLQTTATPTRNSHASLVNSSIFTSPSYLVNPVCGCSKECSICGCASIRAVVNDDEKAMASNLGMEGREAGATVAAAAYAPENDGEFEISRNSGGYEDCLA